MTDKANRSADIVLAELGGPFRCTVCLKRHKGKSYDYSDCREKLMEMLRVSSPPSPYFLHPKSDWKRIFNRLVSEKFGFYLGLSQRLRNSFMGFVSPGTFPYVKKWEKYVVINRHLAQPIDATKREVLNWRKRMYKELVGEKSDTIESINKFLNQPRTIELVERYRGSN